MHRGLPWSRSYLAPSTGAGSGGSALELGHGREENDNRGGTAAGVVLKTIGSAAQAERGKRGRGSTFVWGQEKKGEWGPCIAVSSAGQPAAAPDQRAQAAALFHEQGRAVGRKRHGAGTADRWGQEATGPGGQRWGAGESERE
jgi:hypothetical protein